MSLIPAMQVGDLRQPDNAAPSLHLRYKGFVTTTSGSAPCSSIGILPHGVCHLSFPFASGTRFSRFRVDGDVTAPIPHRPGRAQLRHPVLHCTDSLTYRYSSAQFELAARETS